jgi:hypothetical protein
MSTDEERTVWSGTRAAISVISELMHMHAALSISIVARDIP